MAGIARHQILTKQGSGRKRTELIESGQRLPGWVETAGKRIDRGENAALARLDHIELDATDTDRPPFVLGKRRTPAHHQIRPQLQHRHRLRQAAVKLGQRGFADQQILVTIGKTERLARIAAQQALRLRADVNQPAIGAEYKTQPVVRCARTGPRIEPITPDGGMQAFAEIRALNLQRQHLRRFEQQSVGQRRRP